MKTLLKSNFSDYFFLMFALVILMSCNKDFEESRSWEGRVLEYGTDLPIAGAKILLQDSKGEFLGPVSYFTIDSVITDSKGRFSFRTKDNIAGMRAVVSKENYFTTFGMKTAETGFNLYLDPYAWLKVKIVHNGPIGEFDTFGMEYQSCSPSIIRITEPVTISICERKGNRYHNLSYDLRRTGLGTTNYKFTQFLNGHDTTEYVIQF